MGEENNSRVSEWLEVTEEIAADQKMPLYHVRQAWPYEEWLKDAEGLEATETVVLLKEALEEAN